MCSTRLAEKEQSVLRNGDTAQSGDAEAKPTFVAAGAEEDTDNDTGSVELECRENIDAVNEEGFGSSDEEGMENRVFPQQRLSPSSQRSLTPDVGKIRHSPVPLIARRAKTPDVIYQGQTKSQVSRHFSSETSSLPPKPSQPNCSNKLGDRYGDYKAAVLGKFVKPKLPTTKSSSPGLTISGHFQPTGNVFKPNIPSRNKAKNKPVAAVAWLGTQGKSACQPVMGPQNKKEEAAQAQRGHQQVMMGESANSHANFKDASVCSFSQIGSYSLLTAAVGGGGFSAAAAAATSKPGLSPLPVSVAAQPPVAYHVKGVGGVLSPKGAHPLKPIAPLITAPQAVSTPPNGSLTSSPGSPSRLLLPVQSFLHATSPGAVHASIPASTPSTNWQMPSFSVESLAKTHSVSSRSLIQSFSVTSGTQTSFSPKSVNTCHVTTPIPDVCPSRASADHRDCTRETSRTILKRYLPDGMEEVLTKVNFEKQFAELPEYVPEPRRSKHPNAGEPKTGQGAERESNENKLFNLQTTSEVHQDGSETADPRKGVSSPVPPFSANSSFGGFISPNLDTLAAAAALEQGNENRTGSSSPTHAASLRKTVDRRRQLVLQLFDRHGYFPSEAETTSYQMQHVDVFPTKSMLQLKIRETRQKLKQQSSSTHYHLRD